MNKFIIGALALSSILLSSCTKENVETSEFKSATINLMLETTVGDETVSIDKEYISESDTFSITELKYFLSNFTFSNSETGASLSLDESYVLYNLENGASQTTSFQLNESINFDKLSISFGVDSVANGDFYNTSGDLQPGGQDGMAWSWSTGYKFLKFEGETDTVPFSQHIGTNANYTVIDIPVSGSIEEDGSYTIHIQADILALLDGHHTFDLNTTTGHSHSSSHPIAQNSASGFLSIHHFTGGEFTIGTNEENAHTHDSHSEEETEEHDMSELVSH